MSEEAAGLIPLLYEPVVRSALLEDLGRAGDITTDAVVPPGHRSHGRLVARRAGRVAGLEVALSVFTTLDRHVEAVMAQPDGSDAEAESTLATVAGPTRAILAGERTALNLLGHLSGIATATREMVAAVSGSGAKVVCTRKTTPGLRALEKYAVRMGGGANHRFGLDDAVLVKDNHLAVAGGVKEALARVRARAGHMIKVEVEVDTLAQLAEALEAGVDAVLLDNMAPDLLRRAVRMVDGRAITEASGGISPASAVTVAESGVDLLSVGWLTHSAPALDVALDLDAVDTEG